jgi:hypothetical protein
MVKKLSEDKELFTAIRMALQALIRNEYREKRTGPPLEERMKAAKGFLDLWTETLRRGPRTKRGR